MTLSPHLTRMSLLLSLLLLAPRVGFAQEQTSQPPSEAPTAQEDAPKAQRDAPTAMQPERTADAPPPGSGAHPSMRLTPTAETDRPSQSLRVLAEVGASLLTGIGGGFLGYMSTWAVFSTGISNAPFYALAAPTLVGIGLGLSLGTYWGGQVAGGDASFGGTVLGALVGGTAALLIGAIPDGSPLIGVLLAPPFMLLGSIIGYENTEHGGIPLKRVQPMLSVSPRGAMMGLAGAF
ncbi:hypothetical protein [Archangium sp.]|uniref:hypothetical protein n=1 Tax=Archangium sp. TaxID=1872627 RepID=UPI00389A4CEC